MTVSFNIKDGIGFVHFDRSEKLNALDIDTFLEFERIAIASETDSNIRGLLFTAQGDRAFSVGADISELSKFSSTQALEVARFRQSALMALSNLKIPTVAIIDGYAMGGGLELALACSFRLATAKARFSFPEIKLGLLPGAGGTQRLPKLIGKSRSLEMMLSARVVDAHEARAIGLVNKIIDNPLDEGEAFIREMTQYSRIATSAIIQAVEASDLPLELGMKIENQQLSTINASPDALEGVAAFLEKRPPRFNV
jgi:enoyl-CoA hydratase